MSIKILRVRPREYLQQGLRYCGGYTIKGILSAYNLDDGRSPREYLESSRIVSPEIIKKSLEKYGFKVKINSLFRLSDIKKINVLKKELNKNFPAILLIGNGYSPLRKYNWLKQQILPHYISLWGYNEKKKFFFVYDSYLDKSKYDKIPIGNIKVSYQDILRDWKGSLFNKNKFIYLTLSR